VPLHFQTVAFGSGRAAASSGSGVILRGRGCLTYFELYETTGAASAGVTVFDGGNANGVQRLDYTLTSNQSTSENWDLHYMPFWHGIYLQNNSGTIAGSLTAWMDHDCTEWLLAQHGFYLVAGAEAFAQLRR
jgi:hypothetical protein